MKRERASRDRHIPRADRSGTTRWTRGSLFRIAMFAILLAGVLLLRKPCSEGIGVFIESFDETDAAPAPADAAPGRRFIHISGDMSDEDIRKALESAGVPMADEGAGATDAGAGDAGLPGADTGKSVTPASDTAARQ